MLAEFFLKIKKLEKFAMQYRFIISGGGTGGHIFPAVAIANALKSKMADCEILFVGALGKMEMEKVPQAGYEIEGLEIAGLNRSNPLKNLSLPYKLLMANRRSNSIIKNFKPHAVIGTGGYASFPIVHAAQQKGIDTYIQEQNAYAGKSNQRLGKKAKAVFTAFEDMAKFFDPSKTFDFGNPVRKTIYENLPSKEESLEFFGLNPNKKTISIVGGSLGAKSINEEIYTSLERLDEDNIQVIWQTGATYFETAKARVGNSKNIVVIDFIKEIQMLYRAADVIISRAGASAIAELAIMSRAVVFVPFPFAAEDHQRANAERIVEKDAASMVLDQDMSARLMEVVYKVLFDEKLQETHSKNFKKLAVTDADEKIANKIIENVK